MSIELIKENHKGKTYKTPICKILHRYKGTVAGENNINKYETIYLISGTADISIQEKTKRFHAPARFIIPENTYHKISAVTNIWFLLFVDKDDFPFDFMKENKTSEKRENISVTNILHKETYPDLSIAELQINGEQKVGLNQKSDLLYYISKGNSSFIIDGKEHPVKTGSTLLIPKNITYKNSGNLKLLAIASPRFDSKLRKFLE